MSESSRGARRVRVATPNDAEQIQAIYAPIVRDTSISFEYDPPSVDEMARRINDTLPSHPYLVLEDASEILGYAYASIHRDRAAYRWSVDTTVYVQSCAHRTGVGRSLYEALLAILRRQGFHNVFAGITLPNDKSVELHEAIGFRPLGIFKDVGFKFGRWHDVGWWRLSLSNDLPSGAPIAFTTILDEAEALLRQANS